MVCAYNFFHFFRIKQSKGTIEKEKCSVEKKELALFFAHKLFFHVLIYRILNILKWHVLLFIIRLLIANVGDGPLRGICTTTNGRGECRGYVGVPGLQGFSLEDAVGKGTVQVVKNHPDWPNPYNGITSIMKGDIDQDMGIYLAESEQRSCALAAATTINGILCTSAGGYLVEQLPGCDKESIAKVEQNLKTLVEKDGGDSLPSNLLLNGQTPMDIAGIILDGLDMQPLQQIKPSFFCGCSDERLIRSLRLLPKEDVDDLIEKQEKIEARCEFCGTVYTMGPDEVRERMASAVGDPSRINP